MLRSNLCDYRDAYIVKGDITLTKAANENFIDVRSRFLAFKNNASFTDCVLKINDVLIYNAVNLDFVMSLWNFLDYSKSYRKATGSLWNYYTGETNDFPANNDNSNPIKNSEFLNIKQVLHKKYQMQIKKIVNTLSKKIQRLKTILKSLFR